MKKDWTPEERAAIEARYRAEFTAADLQQYTEEDELIPFDEMIRKLEAKVPGVGEQQRF